MNKKGNMKVLVALCPAPSGVYKDSPDRRIGDLNRIKAVAKELKGLRDEEIITADDYAEIIEILYRR